MALGKLYNAVVQLMMVLVSRGFGGPIDILRSAKRNWGNQVLILRDILLLGEERRAMSHFFQSDKQESITTAPRTKELYNHAVAFVETVERDTRSNNMGVKYNEHFTGRLLSWNEILEIKDRVKSKAVKELISIWKRSKDVTGFASTWGDETEYILVHFDDKKRAATLSLSQDAVLDKWADWERKFDEGDVEAEKFELAPEGGKFMVESIPLPAYGPDFFDLADVEQSMAQRRQHIRSFMDRDEAPITLPTYPRLGVVGGFSNPPLESYTDNDSGCVPPGAYSNYQRWRTCHVNLSARKGQSLHANVPIYRDEQTPWPWTDPTSSEENHVHLDSGMFAAGCCALQVTLQMNDLDEARLVHDQLLVIAPVMLALTAGSPAVKGFLVDRDARWDTTTDLLDDRTESETNGLGPLTKRWSTGPTYLHPDILQHPGYLNQLRGCDRSIRRSLQRVEMDYLLAQYFTAAISRDPILVMEGDVTGGASNFARLYGTSWPAVRLKPPMNDPVAEGWRLEFRPMEVQITDYENAAFVVFVQLLKSVIVERKLNFYVPLWMVAENMSKACRRDAVLTEPLWFRPDTKSSFTAPEHVRQMSIDEIVNGTRSKDEGAHFPGLIPIMHEYIDGFQHVESAPTISRVRGYLDFIGKRARGEYWTAARWIRSFIRAHPEYKKDSVVSEAICYDLLAKIRDISTGELYDLPPAESSRSADS